MRADFGADIKLGSFRAAAEFGYASADSSSMTELAQLTRNTNGANLVAREFWAGLETFGGDGLLRAGRINVPFGLRNIEHTSFVRTATHTDINEDHEYGVAFAISKPTWRAEVMALLGNYSVHPDAYRERGAAGYFELTLAPTSTVGVSALAAPQDLQLSSPPPCTICHATNEGGTGTVVKPFGKYMISRGLAPFDESSLANALAAAEATTRTGTEFRTSMHSGAVSIPTGPGKRRWSRIRGSDAMQRAGDKGAPGPCSFPSAGRWQRTG
jgi:hypothetical protein